MVLVSGTSIQRFARAQPEEVLLNPQFPSYPHGQAAIVKSYQCFVQNTSPNLTTSYQLYCQLPPHLSYSPVQCNLPILPASIPAQVNYYSASTVIFYKKTSVNLPALLKIFSVFHYD